eukprot:1820758-Pyramimonas_sp.AAC.1
MARGGIAGGTARVRQALGRGRRMQSMKAAGVRVNAVFMAAPSSSFLWGRAVVGATDGDLRCARVAARRGAGRPRRMGAPKAAAARGRGAARRGPEPRGVG